MPGLSPIANVYNDEVFNFRSSSAAKRRALLGQIGWGNGRVTEVKDLQVWADEDGKAILYSPKRLLLQAQKHVPNSSSWHWDSNVFSLDCYIFEILLKIHWKIWFFSQNVRGFPLHFWALEQLRALAWALSKASSHLMHSPALALILWLVRKERQEIQVDEFIWQSVSSSKLKDMICHMTNLYAQPKSEFPVQENLQQVQQT